MMSTCLIFLVGFLVAAVVTPPVISIYHHHRWLDDPEKNRHAKTTHTQPVPRGGGIPIFIAFIVGSLLFLPIDKYLIAIMAASLLLTTVGILDDIFDLSPHSRLVTGGIAGLIVVGAGIGIAYVTNPFGSGVIHLDQYVWNLELLGKTRSIWVLADLFALIFILWNMNIVNWSKGVDGQLPAFAVISFIFIGLVSNNFSADPTEFNNAMLSFLLAGAFAGLLIYNWYPQKIMPGYGGGSLAGFFLAVLAILSGAKVATILMVLAVPTADAIYTILRRLLTRKSPLWGDRQHLHHQMLDEWHWNKKQVSIFYALSSFIMGGLALILNTQGKITALILSFLVVFIFQIWTKIKPNYDQA